MKLAIIGQGGHSKVIQDIILAYKGIEIVGYLDDKYENSYFNQGIYYGPILSAKKMLDYFEDIKFIIAIGNNRVRKMIVEKLNLFRSILCCIDSSICDYQYKCQRLVLVL